MAILISRQLIERIIHSRVHYWISMCLDLAGAVAFLALGIAQFSGRHVMVGTAVVVGFLSWSLFEYMLHRWILHGPPSLARRGHILHHADPTALVSTPLLIIMSLAVASWALLQLVIPVEAATFLIFGLYAGYNYYVVVHHLQHHRAQDLARVGYLRRLEGVHHVHHRRHVVNFGISTTLWDRVFGTFRPEEETATATGSRARSSRSGAH